MEKANEQSDIIRDKAFGKRFTSICDDHPLVPAANFGRLQWFSDQFAKYGEKVSKQTISRWLDGAYRPRPAKMKLLASILGVDESWLSLGIDVVSPSEAKTVRAVSNGAALVVAGFVQMAGGHIAFPEEGDESVGAVDFYVIAGGRQRKVKVCVADVSGRDLTFRLPNNHTSTIIVGGVRQDAVSMEFYHLTPATIASSSSRRGGHVEVKAEKKSVHVYVSKAILPKITDFMTLLA